MILNHIGLSGGKDSTALWGWAINESGYPIDFMFEEDDSHAPCKMGYCE